MQVAEDEQGRLGARWLRTWPRCASSRAPTAASGSQTCLRCARSACGNSGSLTSTGASQVLAFLDSPKISFV